MEGAALSGIRAAQEILLDIKVGALGYNHPTSAFGAFLQSTLFEYTIEGVMRPPS
jgi:hypothetical protein